MRKAAILLFMLVLFSGCVEERQITVTGYEQIQSMSGSDLTGDGVNDFILTTYGSKPINPEAGVYIKKTVAVYPVSLDAQIITYTPMTEYDLQYVKNRISEFSEAKEGGEGSCFSSLGVDRAKCVDAESCAEECSSTACERAKEYGENTLGNELYMFNRDSEELDRLASEVGAISSVSTQAERDALGEKITRIMALSSKLSSNLMFRQDVFNVCGKPSYDSGTLAAALSRVGNATIGAGNYEYKVAIIVEREPGDQNLELYVKDSPPLLLSVDQLTLDVLEDGKLFEKEPLTVGWNAVELDASRKVLYYDFVSATEPSDEILSKWRFPKVTERNLMALTYLAQAKEHPVGAFIFYVSESAFNSALFLGYYAALGTAFSVWVVLLFLLIFLGELAYFILKAIMDRKNIRETLIDSFGAPMADWKTYAAAAFVLVGSAIMVNMFYIAPVSTTGFSVEELATTLGSDPAGAACVLLFIIGVYTFFLVVEDWLKGLILGPEYYQLKSATKEENLRALSELRESWQALKMRVEDLSKTGMLVTEEYGVIVSVPLERLEQMIASGKQGMAKQLLLFNQERLESLDHKLDEKVNVMNQKWPEWEKDLEKALSGSDHVPLNTLLFIPLQWREWAVEKYIGQNRAKGYTLDGDVVIRRAVKVDELLARKVEEMVKNGIAKQEVLLSQDMAISNSFGKGKRTIAGALFLKLKKYSEALSKKMGAKEVRRFVVSGEKTAAVYVSHGTYHAFIAADKARIKEVVEEWNGMLEKLK